MVDSLVKFGSVFRSVYFILFLICWRLCLIIVETGK